MKNRLLQAVLMLTVMAFIACGGKQDSPVHDQVADSEEWKGMDEFHMVMAETFHPYKDSANLAPAKEKAGELATAAENWANKNLPEKVDNDEMKEKLKNLQTETVALKDMVASGRDEEIGSQLTKVHDMFHEIQEAWYGGGDHEHNHGHEH